MAIQNFDFPSVTLKQVFETAATSTVGALGVACVGPQYKLHRADVAGEAALISQSSLAYTEADGLVVAALPGRDVLNTLDADPATQHLVVKGGVFRYFTATASALVPDIQEAPNGNAIRFSAAVRDGNGYTASVNFGTRGVKINDFVTLTDTAALTPKASVDTRVVKINSVTDLGYAEIVVEDIGTFTATDTVTVAFCLVANARYEAGDDTFAVADGALTIEGGLTTALSERGGITGTLQSGALYIEYRERMSTFVGKLGTVSSVLDVEALLGGALPDNPLALAVYSAAAAAKGTVVYFTGVRTDDAAGYTEALDYLEKFSNVYSIVLATENADCILAALQMVEAASEDEDSKVRRTLWYGITAAKELELFTDTATTAAGKITFDTSVFVDHPAATGDVLVTAGGDVYTITSTNSVNSADVTGTPSLSSATGVTFTLLRTKPTSWDLVSAIIAMRQTVSYRAQCVWADGVLFNGYEVPNFFVAAAAAGMRSYEACHRPLSNLGYSFFSIDEAHGFTRSQLKQIGANGIWIVANNEDGLPINMRQITTSMSNDVNRDEESIIANVDEIALALSRVGMDKVGSSNISIQLIAALNLDITMLMDQRLLNTSGSIYVGPQLTAWELLSLYQDTVNRDHVYADISCTPPKPFNKFHMTLRVI